MSLIPVAPTLGSLFVQSWQIYRAHLFPLLGLTLVLLVPALLLSLSGVDQLDESNIAMNMTFSLRKLAFRLENWPISQENVYFLSKTDLLARKRVFSAGDARFRWKMASRKAILLQ